MLDDLSILQQPQEVANRIRRKQMRGAIEQMRVFVIGNTFFAPVLAVQAWNSGINGAVVAWTVVMLTFSWWLFLRWRKSYLTHGSEEDMRIFVAETRVNASLWCLGMVLFYPFVTGDQKTILTTVMAGSLALGTVGFAQAPRAAFSYLAIHTVTLTSVPLVFGLIWGTTADLMLAALAFISGVAIFNATLERARTQMKAFLNFESLNQKVEVIDLLLKDYEEQGEEWVWQTDAEGKVISCPAQVLALMNISNLTGRAICMWNILKAHVDPRGEHDLALVNAAFTEKQEFYDVTLPFLKKSEGTMRWIIMRGRPQFEGDSFVGFRGIFADATSGVEAQKQVEFLAVHDPLTGTHNRNRVQKLLTDLDPDTDTSMVYLIDLDGFKQVNDSYGHAIGDKLLQCVARRLKDTIGPNDTIARLGGDEFLILTSCPNKFTALDPNALSNRLLTRLSDPFFIDQYDIALSASIGTANFPQDTTVGPNLLNQADLALYAAKNGGRNRCVAFVTSMQAGLQKRMIVTDRLRLAVKNNEILPNYQPQYCSQTKQLLGFEALARWTDSELGNVGPDIFIPIAEETGLIHDIGAALLLAACEDALKWTVPDGMPLPTVSVNVSPVQVMRGNVVDLVKTVLKETGLPAERLEIEVTEGVLIDDMVGTRKILDKLSQLGVAIALDDFGTGYSSLSYIRALPLHRLKIDRSFIADMEDLEAQSVVQTIIDLCRRLDLSVIAEGVETEENVALLSEMRCDVLQGYHFSRAIPALDVQDLLNGRKTAVA